MKTGIKIFVISTVLLLTVFSAKILPAEQEFAVKSPAKSQNPQSENTVVRDRDPLTVNNRKIDTNHELASSKRNPQSEIKHPKSVNSNPSNPQSAIQNPKFEKAEVLQKTKKLQMPFIANEGQTDAKVAFYANTFGGTVFVTKSGEIVYALPKSGDVEDGETHRKAAKCTKERSEKHISHKDTKNTEEMIEGGMDKPCLSVLPATTGHAWSGCPPPAEVDGNFADGWHGQALLVRDDGTQEQPPIVHAESEFLKANIKPVVWADYQVCNLNP